MKPCSKNRKLIAWLVLGSLEADRAGALREHIELCGRCRQYFNEISNVTASLGSAEIKTSREAGASFHRRVVARVQARRPSLLQSTLQEFFGSLSLNWRVVLPMAGGMAIIVGLLLIRSQQPPAHQPGLARILAPAARDLNVEYDLEPTINNYQMVANNSLDKLDQLLTEQGARSLPRVATYTAGTVATESE